MRPRIDRSVAKPAPRARAGMSRLHLERVGSLPCLVTGKRDGVHVHHLLRSIPPSERGIGRKASDRYCLPLHWEVHRAVHDSGDDEAYLTERGFDGRAVADALWANRSNIEAMERIIWRARQEASLKKGRLWA